MIHIPVDEKKVTDAQVFEAFDLNYPGLEAVRDAWQKQDFDSAKIELASYFHTRSNVSFLFDYRGTPLKRIGKDANQDFFQATMGLKTDFEEFMNYAGNNMMNHIYILPGDRGKPIHLGARLESAPHFNIYEDEGKRSRTPANIFTRGQWMEYLFVLYQNTGDQNVAEKFSELLQCFFDEYALYIENTGVSAPRFQYAEDRTVMSVGWLALVYIELLYTELAYAVDHKMTFEIIKRIWFIGSQFRRFRDDAYRLHNHHLWERGIMPFMLGILFPEIPDFAAMKDHGAKVVSRHVMDDFNAQGGYNEFSIAYWSGAALSEMIFRGMYLAKLNREPLLDQEAMERMNKTFCALAQAAPPAEQYPSIGDGGGARTNRVLDLGIKMADHKWCRELLEYRTGISTEPPSMPLYYSDDLVGFTCGRTDFGRQATYFLMAAKVDCGSSGHNHMDMLSLNVIIRGEEFIGEPYAGTLYPRVCTGSPQRGYMRNMTSHNTVLAYGKPIAEDEMYADRSGMFRPDSPVQSFRIYPEGMYAQAFHDAYSYCRHERSILFADNGTMLVRDEIKRGGNLKKLHVQKWHLMPEVICQKAGENAVLLEKNGVKLLCVWHGNSEIILWKDDEILCPEIYPTSEKLGYNIDIRFETSVEMAMIDVTEKEGYHIGTITELLKEAETDMEQNEMLRKLQNL